MGRRAPVLEVMEFPGTLDTFVVRLSLGEAQSYSYDDRPNIVLDCSKIDQVDKPSIQLLLCCLEEAIKRNGDVRLAAVPAGARATLKLTGVDRIFEIFDTNADAVNSFQRLSVNTASQLIVLGTSQPDSENAA